MNKELVASIILILCTLSRAEVNKTNVLKVLDKLEIYALGSDHLGSGLTVRELKEAHAEFESWDVSNQRSMGRIFPMIQLLADFLFYPMRRFDFLIGEDEKVQKAFIKRFEVNYLRFRLSYLGYMTVEYCIKCLKTNTLVDSMFGVNNSRPLTLKLLQDAEEEFDAYKLKEREIAEVEDIYANLDDLELFRTYLALPYVQVLSKHIFPLLKDTREGQLPTVKKLFIDQMAKRKFGVRDGQIVQLQ